MWTWIESRRVRRIVVLGLLVAFVPGAVAAAHSMFRCRFDGVARRQCCCPGGAARSPGMALKRDCCCDLEHVDLHATTFTSSDARVKMDGPPPAAVVHVAWPIRSTASAAWRRVEATLHVHGPPLILLKSSFLI